jgi:UDP-N-acetylmuramoylalanine-D-glutamate ligase
MNKINKVAIFGVGKSGKAAIRLAKKHHQDVYIILLGLLRLYVD